MGLAALILDYGEVLVRPQSAVAIERMAHLANLDPAEFRRRYWQHRREYDSGTLSGPDYWRTVNDTLPLESIAAVEHADYESWIDYREEVWTIAAAFRARGGRTAILSNGVPEVMVRVTRERDLARTFDVVIVSYEVGVTKPDARIYELCLSRLGVEAAAALFVDDRPENIDGAARVGMQTLHFTGDASVDALRSTLGLT
jgi:putative hydrolase of the HAD superfamily